MEDLSLENIDNFSPKNVKRRWKLLIRASFFLVASQGVCLAEQSESGVEEDYIDCVDDYDDILLYERCEQWEGASRFQHSRSNSSHKKPKVTRKEAKAATLRKEMKAKENIQCCVRARKGKVERSLQKRGVRRFGQEIYSRRSNDRNQITTLTATSSYAPHKSKRIGAGSNSTDHPAALRHELRVKNTTDELPRQLADLQHRDLSPEDYDLLLRLDETVSPKTVSKSLLKSFETVTLDNQSPLLGNVCSICMESYTASQSVKTLPCHHYFHADCIDVWLCSASLNCPLDGIIVGT